MSFDQPLPPFNASDPTATFVSSSCLDFLMIEVVPMAYRVTNELEEVAAASTSTSTSSSRPTAAIRAGENGGGGGGGGGGRRGNGGGGGGNKLLDEDEERDAVFYRLETLGYRVGMGLVERFVWSYSFPLPSLLFLLSLSLSLSLPWLPPSPSSSPTYTHLIYNRLPFLLFHSHTCLTHPPTHSLTN